MKLSTNRQLHALLNQTGLMEQKASLIYSFSEGLTDSAKELKEYQAIELIKHLKTKLPSEKQTVVAEKPKDPRQGVRRYIISRFYLMEGAKTEQQKKEALGVCLKWVEKHFKGDLNSFDLQTLFKIRNAVENALKDRAKAVRRAVKMDDT